MALTPLQEAVAEAFLRLKMNGIYCPAKSDREVFIITEQLLDDCTDAGWAPEQLLAAVKAYRRQASRQQASGALHNKPWPDFGMLQQALRAAQGPARVLELTTELAWLEGLAQRTLVDEGRISGLPAAQRIKARTSAIQTRETSLVLRYGQYTPEPLVAGISAVGGWRKLAELGEAGRRVFVQAASGADLTHQVGEGGAPRRAFTLQGRPVGPRAPQARSPRRLEMEDGLVRDERGRLEHPKVVARDGRLNHLAARLGQGAGGGR